jgi:hypothetical protein
MLQRTDTQAAYCYQRAEENRRRAEQQVKPEYKETYLDLERRWLTLAMSYEFGDRLNQYAAHVACALDDQKSG